jgi:hypothetical protein
MGYIPPQDVSSPREHWELVAVLYDGGPGQPSLALGRWDGQDVIGTRWNGDDAQGSALGNPQSRGLATWFILPHWLAAPALRELATRRAEGDDRVKSVELNRALEVFAKET